MTVCRESGKREATGWVQNQSGENNHLFSLVHFGVRLTLVLEDGIPTYLFRRGESVSKPARERKALRTKMPGTSGGNDSTFGPTLEQDRLLTGTGTVRKSADRVGRLVVVGGEQVVEAFVAESLEEMFSFGRKRAMISDPRQTRGYNLLKRRRRSIVRDSFVRGGSKRPKKCLMACSNR